MSAERNTSCALALLMSMDVKFVNTFQRNAQYFIMYVRFLRTLLTYLQSIINHGDLQSTALKRR